MINNNFTDTIFHILILTLYNKFLEIWKHFRPSYFIRFHSGEYYNIIFVLKEIFPKLISCIIWIYYTTNILKFSIETEVWNSEASINDFVPIILVCCEEILLPGHFTCNLLGKNNLKNNFLKVIYMTYLGGSNKSIQNFFEKHTLQNKINFKNPFTTTIELSKINRKPLILTHAVYFYLLWTLFIT